MSGKAVSRAADKAVAAKGAGDMVKRALDAPRMSTSIAEVLYGPPARVGSGQDSGAGLLELHRMMWQVVEALRTAPLGDGMAFAARGVARGSLEPEMPELDFTFDFVWPQDLPC